MPKYIEANDLLNRALAEEIDFCAVDGTYDTGVTINDLQKIVDKMPDITRCSNCKHFTGLICLHQDGCVKPNANGFCQYGEAK